jgi:RNA polymerase sigma-70 factor (ECF subfamily)
MKDREAGTAGLEGLSDAELVKKIQNGERELLEELAERYLSAVYNRVVRAVPPADVEDLTQEIMMAIVRSVDRFGARSSVPTWVHAIVNNKLKYYYRQRRSQSRVSVQWAGSDGEESEEPPVAAPSDEPLARLMEADEQGAVARIVDDLRPSYQQVLRLRFTDDLSFKEIGAEMKMSLDAVKSLFRRAVAEAAKRMRRFRQAG